MIILTIFVHALSTSRWLCLQSSEDTSSSDTDTTELGFQCPICLSSKKGLIIRTPCCKQKLHEHCLSQCSQDQTSNTCKVIGPTCRESMSLIYKDEQSKIQKVCTFMTYFSFFYLICSLILLNLKLGNLADFIFSNTPSTLQRSWFILVIFSYIHIAIACCVHQRKCETCKRTERRFVRIKYMKTQDDNHSWSS